MEQTAMAGGPNPLDESGLCMLSFDGGGVRGLSSLYILDHIMRDLNHQRVLAGLPTKKPCEIFDLIGGTSTGGLIAIMLGRLEMDVGECIAAYCKLSESVFKVKKHWSRVTARGKIQPRFDSQKLKVAIETVLKDRKMPPTAPFNDRVDRGCKVFVCATSAHSTTTRRLRSYDTVKEPSSNATIVEVAMATSAATTFFEPVTIDDMKYLDGGLGANNPVDEVVGEARYIMGRETEDLKPLVKCFISIGTGNPGMKSISDNFLQFVSETLVRISTNTESTAHRFALAWRDLSDAHRYFRFNVEQGLQDVELSEYKESGKIKMATQVYLEKVDSAAMVGKCVANLKTKQKPASKALAEKIQAFNITIQSAENNSLPPPKYCLPFAKNKRFVGRETILKKLSDAFFGEEPCERVALAGLGGAGKTQTALEFAFWVKHEKPEYSIFWLSALSASSFEQSCNTVATELGIFQQGLDSKAILRDFLSSKKPGPWLIIVDNADERGLILGGPGHSFSIDEQLPQSPAGRILFTTRSNEVALEVADEEPLQLGEMKPAEALEFLGKSINSKLLLADPSVVSELLEELTYLPLAIGQAAAYLNRNKVTVTRYLELLRGTEKEMTSLLSHEFHDRTRYRGSQNAVATTWRVSFDQILAQDPMAANLLKFISRIEPKDIPLPILPRGDLEEELTYSVGTLCSYAFLVPREDQEVYDMHSLVHLATRIWVQRSGLSSQTTIDAYKHLAAVLQKGRGQQPYWRQCISHALRVLQSEDRIESKEKLLLSSELGNYVIGDRRIREADECCQESFNWAKGHLSEDDLDRLDCEGILALTHLHRGQLDKSFELLQHVVAELERLHSFDKDLTPLLRTLQNLKSVAHFGTDEKEITGILRRITDLLNKLPSGHPALECSWPWLMDALLAETQASDAYELLQNLYEGEVGTKQSRTCRLIRQYYLGITSHNRNTTAIVKRLEYEIEILQNASPSSAQDLLYKQDVLRLTSKYHNYVQRGAELAQYLLAMVEGGWVDNATLRSVVTELWIAQSLVGGSAARVNGLERMGSAWGEHGPKGDMYRLAFQNQVGEAFLEDGQTLRAVSILRGTAKIWKATAAWDGNPQLLEVQHNLGMAYYTLGHRGRAVKLLEHVAAIRRKILPEDNMRRVKTEKLLEVVRKEMEQGGRPGGR